MGRVILHALAALVSVAAPFSTCAQEVIYTLAGKGEAGFSGDGGAATSAALNSPSSMALDAAGNLYIADTANHRIRKVSPSGVITTVAGGGVGCGFAFSELGDGQPAGAACLFVPSRVTLDAAANLYIADSGNHRIRKVGLDGIITTVAGNGMSAYFGDGGPATRASLKSPTDVALDAAGNLYIADSENGRIRKVSLDGTITTVAGNGSCCSSSADGSLATSVSLSAPTGVAVDAAGGLYIAESGRHRIRKVGPDATITLAGRPAMTITTVAGDGSCCVFFGDGGAAVKASLNSPFAVAVDAAGNLFIADRFNQRIRKVSLDGIITTAAGSGIFGFSGDGDLATGARLGSPSGVALEAEGVFFIADKGNNRIRKVQPVPQFSVQPSSLNFQVRLGAGGAPSQTLSITNAASGRLNWAVQVAPQSGGNWLSVSPTAGATPATISVSVSEAGLSPGTYQGYIVIAHLIDPTRPQTVNVTLSVTPAGAARIALSPSSLQFASSVAANPPAQTFQLQNAGTGTLDWTAAAATQSGGNWLAVTPTTGAAPSTLTVNVNSVSLPVGIYTGSITITALASANAANSPQVLPVTLAVSVPAIGRGGVLNGASFSRDAVVSPGSIAALFGINLAAGTETAGSLPLPTALAGTQVLVNNTPAPLFFVSPSQINFQIPGELAGTTAQVVVVSGGVRGPAAAVNVAPEAPGIFTAPPGGSGQGAVLNEDLSPNSAQNPAPAGSVVQIFATGLGATNPPAATGQPGAISPPFHRTALTPVVTVGGAPAEVLFSALAPGFVGLYQVNVRVPAATPRGSAVPLQVEIGGRSSNTVTLAVR